LVYAARVNPKVAGTNPVIAFYIYTQGCSSGAGTRRNAVPVNIFQPERRSGKESRHAPERLRYSVPANIR